MAFYKFTSIAGTRNGQFKCFTMNGHWNLDAAISYARRHNLKGQLDIEHCVSDLSGGGRGGHDGRWNIGPRGKVTKAAKWAEFGREH